MKLDIDFTQIPQSLTIDVQKGTTGIFVAEVVDLGVVTEAEDLNELFINVNDVIYTYFDIPKKYQDKIQFVPNVAARGKLITSIGEVYKKDNLEHIKVNTYYTEDLFRSIMST